MSKADTLSRPHDTSPEDPELAPETGIKAELFENTNFDIVEQRKRWEEWPQTGDCPGATAIGRISLTADQQAALKALSPEEYGDVVFPRFTGDKRDSCLVVNRDSIWGEIKDALDGLVAQDLERSGLGKTYGILFDYIKAGGYSGVDFPFHIDTRSIGQSPRIFQIRYGLTLAGPTTRRLVGVTDPAQFIGVSGAFQGEGDPSTPNVPDDVGVVNRFLTDCDPHAGPEPAADTFRAYLDLTVAPSELLRR